MAKEVLKFFEGHCPVNDKPESFSVTYVERGDGSFERRDLRDCRFKGLFNPRGCVECELIREVRQVVKADEIDLSSAVEEFVME
ncbi:MAG: hypothetical protein LBL23_04425 [Coriobacteriales bacterium]|jgi:hypothetical protein|nr:hypothetical protein [Coriobacteriales bacterium]